VRLKSTWKSIQDVWRQKLWQLLHPLNDQSSTIFFDFDQLIV